jgi:transglutaminase-like putative cysteine protease/predicted esterase
VLALALAPQAPVDEDLAQALQRAGDNAPEIRRAIAEAPEALRADMRFLVRHMPETDLRSLDAAFLLENARLAAEARTATPWAQAVPEDVWRNAVLPYAQVNEEREAWRADFRERFAPLVADAASTTEATMRLNAHIFGELGVKYSTKRNRPDQAPSESIEIGLASCTGLSILLADACRAVGVPARLAGTANWFDSRGNHTWVEIWDGGRWHFVGAAEPDPNGLNRGWFAGDAARATPGSREFGIWAATWEQTGDSLPMVWARDVDWVPAVDVTARYLPSQAAEVDGAGDEVVADPTVDLLFAVRGADGERVVAELRLRDPETREVVFAGETRDESKDANDFLIATVAPMTEWMLEINHAGLSWSYQLSAGNDARQTLSLQLEEARNFQLAGQVRAAAKAWFEAAPEERAGIDFAALDAALAPGLGDPNREESIRRQVWEAYRDAAIHTETLEDVRANRVRHGGHESPYTIKTVGERPANGWPLVIAMHGGGGTTQEFNDSQWRHMQIYYKEQLDLPGGYKYLALRAPNNTWNGFYDNYVYPLIEKLINQHLLFGDVDPDKIYAIGYSHGGYGAFAIGPKIPDRFAAVHSSAAAPTDGETSAVGLHTLRFTYMIGSEDKAYGRADRCQAFAEQYRALQERHPGAYPVEMFWIEGNGHGGLPDRDFVRELYPYTRRTTPDAVHWQLTDPVVRHHYWLQVDAPGKGQRVHAQLAGNEAQIQSEQRDQLALLLQPGQVDVTQPLRVNWNGAVSEHALAPSLRTLCETLLERGDPRLMSALRVDLRRE